MILADSADNPTGGGVGDRADVLNALIAHGGFAGALMLVTHDRALMALCDSLLIFEKGAARLVDAGEFFAVTERQEV